MRAARILMIDEGHSVRTAHDGVAGKRLAAALDYDILLLDLRLPLASGFEILRSVKARRGSIGIIVMSGYPYGSKLPSLDVEEDAEDLLRGAHTVLHKPFDVRELLEAIRALSEGAGSR
jgi:DNA-binding response OmpR family regulator